MAKKLFQLNQLHLDILRVWSILPTGHWLSGGEIQELDLILQQEYPKSSLARRHKGNPHRDIRANLTALVREGYLVAQNIDPYPDLGTGTGYPGLSAEIPIYALGPMSDKLKEEGKL